MNDDQKRTADLLEKCNAAYKKMALDDRMRHMQAEIEMQRQNNREALRQAALTAFIAHHSYITLGAAYQGMLADLKNNQGEQHD